MICQEFGQSFEFFDELLSMLLNRSIFFVVIQGEDILTPLDETFVFYRRYGGGVVVVVFLVLVFAPSEIFVGG